MTDHIMHLDLTTLMAAGSFVAALSGMLLVAAWVPIRSAPALLWWAGANFVYAIGIAAILYGTASNAVPLVVAGAAIIAISPALVWAGARTFSHKPVRVLFLLAGPVAWVAAALLPVEGGSQGATALVGFACAIIYLLAAAFEIALGRNEMLKARWPLVAFFLVHAAIFSGGIFDVIFGRMLEGQAPPLYIWFGAIHFESLIYSIGTAVFMVVICKELTEHGFKEAAFVDALTGSATRRAFFESAEGLIKRCRTGGMPLSVIVFDLDRLKSVNDTYGHPVGDRVLRLFADTVRALMRPNDLVGRHGGEEFAVVLPGTTIETAYVIADRMRHAFAENCRTLETMPLYSTVSAGVAAATPNATFANIMEEADRAMYRAKNLGRNRVERADQGLPSGKGKVIRLA